VTMSDSTFGEKLADKITSGMGSWKFIIFQAVFTGAWIVANILNPQMWDHYPFVLLNLVYSFQAGFTGPILLLSSNRQSARDRANLEKDLAVDMEQLQLLQTFIVKFNKENNNE